ncbi:unnamed protein product (mitochondrion) [Plasmodiophora brassicae]|uniref:Origin recognition complex subunit 1 n=1 Tax=Plasmodiophora brassicae TaxID=37360 RepID=A0A0G4J0X0_PLABS|nr:hypothetical protein PBRA_008316 [Plasmodiophora brassicae]SPQ95285.1 unnamed protein product [Plasmodiophora brassicae]
MARSKKTSSLRAVPAVHSDGRRCQTPSRRSTRRDDDESPTKRARRDPSTPPATPANAIDSAWASLLASTYAHAGAAAALPSTSIENDDVCVVCHEPGVLYPCGSCLQAICADCVPDRAAIGEAVDQWHCPDSGLTCSDRIAKLTVADADADDAGDGDGPAVSDDRRRSMSTAKSGSSAKIGTLHLRVGDDVVMRPSAVPGPIRTRLWGTPPSTTDEDGPFLARVVLFVAKGNLAQVHFFVRPRQTRCDPTAMFDNELLLTTTRYDVPLHAIVGRAPIPIRVGAEGERRKATKKGRRTNKAFSAYLLRHRYDIVHRVRRPLLESDAGAGHAMEVVDVQRAEADVSDAIGRMQLSSAPTSLPCRDLEFAEIQQFITDAVRVGGYGAGLYVSGQPGTGKTATVRRVIDTLSRTLPFRPVEINALKLQSPVHVYSALWSAIGASKRNVSPGRALLNLQEYFSPASVKGRRKKKAPVVVVVLDEFDYLIQGKQNRVVYNLFGLPSTPSAGLVIIAIANRIDLPERLESRVFSRLGFQRLNFEAYTKDQIMEIIVSRLRSVSDLDVTNDAVSLCAATVAGTCGDVRQALRLMESAVELAQADGTGTTLTFSHVVAARKLLEDTVAVQLIRMASYHELVVLCAVVQDLHQTGLYVADYDSVVRRHGRIATQQGRQELARADLHRIIDGLADANVIRLVDRRGRPRPGIELAVSEPDIVFAVRGSPYDKDLSALFDTTSR